MIINDDALGKLGINPTLFDEDQKRRISLYFDRIDNGVASDSLYPSSESLDSECEAIRARCKKEDLHIKDLINKAKEALEPEAMAEEMSEDEREAHEILDTVVDEGEEVSEASPNESK